MLESYEGKLSSAVLEKGSE